MPATCAFFLDNNQPCRAPALHNDRYCRHHTPDALRHRRLQRSGELEEACLDGNSPDGQFPSRNESSYPPNILRAYWRTHHRIILTADATDCDEIFEMVLGALGNHDISPRSAGRLLQAILDRRRLLADQAQEAAFRALEEKVRQHKALARHPPSPGEVAAPGPSAQRSSADQALLEALRTAVFPTAAPQHPAPHPFGASENYPVFR
ncbi:MAG: hypothetical protein WB622_06795 [Acidobacteriaceae bacterium]